MLCLYGSESDNVCAYCKKHKKGMTVKQVKKRQCLKRRCRNFKENKDHPWWKQREAIKAKRKARKTMYQ